VTPFNITYQYPDWGKNQIEIICKTSTNPPCTFAYVQAIRLAFNLTDLNFSCDPSIWGNCTNSNFNWGQFTKVFGSGACTGQQACLLVDYELNVTDSQGKLYRCPGTYGPDQGNTRDVNCPETTWNWYDPDSATLSIKSNPCWVKLYFGSDGDFLIKGSQPNSENGCNFTADTLTKFEFNTSNFSFNAPSLLSVRDLAWNSSKTINVN